MATLELNKLTKRFGDLTVVKGVDLSVADREFVVLVGPSGCGKSTILRMIAGLEEISDGEISIGGTVVNELEPKNRSIAMVFQDYALYPHLTVARNMSFGLENQKIARHEIQERVAEASAILGLTELMERKPRQLSGGQRQRVAMGRAIVRNPKVFLFDEPLSNLDAKLRGQMRMEIKKLHQRVQTTIIFVTHDQVEAMTLADRVVVLRDGRIEQVGPPEDLYNFPASRFVAGFIGSPTMNFFDAEILRNGQKLRLPDGSELSVPKERRAALKGRERITFGVRPEGFEIAAKRSPAAISAEITLIEPLGSDTLIFFANGDQEFVARVSPRQGIRPGDTVTLAVNYETAHFFDTETEQRLTAGDAT